MESALFAYTIRAHKQRDKAAEVKVDGLHGTDGDGDLLDSFDATMTVGAQWPQPPAPGQTDTRETVSPVEEVHTAAGDDRVRYGRVRVTRGAVGHDVTQHGTGATIAIRDEDREGRPLFFWLVAPTGSTNALVLTERRARFGIVGDVWKGLLIGGLRRDFDQTTFEFNYYVHTPVWEQYLERGDRVEGVVLRRVMVEEREDRELDNATRREVIGTIVTEVDRSVVPARQRVADLLRQGDRGGAIELVMGDRPEQLGDAEEYESFALRLVLGGRHRTVVLGRDRVPQLGHDVTGVGHDAEGYPRVADMADFASTLARRIGGPLGIR